MTLAFKNQGGGLYTALWNVNGKTQIEIGDVEKDNVGNWIATTPDGRRLSDWRRVISRDEEATMRDVQFDYFETRFKAAAALRVAAGIKV